jgi:hypothetical protein
VKEGGTERVGHCNSSSQWKNYLFLFYFLEKGKKNSFLFPFLHREGVRG